MKAGSEAKISVSSGLRLLRGGRRAAGPILFLVSALVFSGCYDLFFRTQDEKNVRRQLHIPRVVKLVSLDSDPKTSGFFGREGLRIWAVFAFDHEQLQSYLGEFENRALWKPVPFLSYSPRLADEYSDAALAWSDGPAPAWTFERLKGWEFLADLRGARHAKYYASVIIAERGKRIDHPGGGNHYEWKYLGKAASELIESSNTVILTFGFLDLEARKLYAFIAFSG